MAKTPTVSKAKLHIPSSKVEIALTAGSVEPAMKAAEAKSTKLFRVPVSAIKTIPGFNVRVDSADYQEHRDMIKGMISANGYDPTKPLAGYVAKEGDTNVIYVTDGHTRLDAVNILNEENPESQIATLPVLVHPADKSLEDLTVALHTANSGRRLTPFELGIVVKRLLREEGADKKALAKRLGVTARYIDDVLLLVNGPKEVRQAVLNGTVASTLAITELRRDPEKAAERLVKAGETAKAKGKKKVTAKDIGPKMQQIKTIVPVEAGAAIKDINKAVRLAIADALPNSTEGDGEEAVNTADVAGSITVIVEVPAPKKPAAKPAAKKAKVKDAPSPVVDKTVVAKAKKSKRAKKPKADIGIPGAEEVSDEGLDDEVAIMPPVVPDGEGAEEADDDVDI